MVFLNNNESRFHLQECMPRKGNKIGEFSYIEKERLLTKGN